MNPSLRRLWPARRVPPPKAGPATRLAANLPAGRGLRFTEWLLAGVLAVAYLESISQPLFTIRLNLTSLNHLPLILLAPVILLHLGGVMLNRDVPRWQAIFAVCWPLVLLALFALVGSSVAKWELNEHDTYLTFAVYLLLLPLFAAAAPVAADRVRPWAGMLIAIWLLASLAALAGELARPTVKESLHEIEYLVTSGFLVAYYALRRRSLKLLVFALLLGAAVVNHKLTGYAIATMAFVHITVAAGWRRLPRQWRAPYAVAAAVLTAALVAVLTLLYFEYRDYLPSGNVEVRLRQYEAVWRSFVDSPVWGHAYLQNSGENYTESYRVLNIPTHSDVLDILKHGGLIGLALFAGGYWKIFALIQRAVAATRSDLRVNAYFVGVRFFQVTALVTFAINPILLKGPFLIVIWGNLGLAVGLALAVTRGRAPAAAA